MSKRTLREFTTLCTPGKSSWGELSSKALTFIFRTKKRKFWTDNVQYMWQVFFPLSWEGNTGTANFVKSLIFCFSPSDSLKILECFDCLCSWILSLWAIAATQTIQGHTCSNSNVTSAPNTPSAQVFLLSQVPAAPLFLQAQIFSTGTSVFIHSGLLGFETHGKKHSSAHLAHYKLSLGYIVFNLWL